jgi:hypothetical protein
MGNVGFTNIDWPSLCRNDFDTANGPRDVSLRIEAVPAQEGAVWDVVDF